jgi:hypothetical protein
MDQGTACTIYKDTGKGLFVCEDDHFLTTSFLHCRLDRSELHLPFLRSSVAPCPTEIDIDMDPPKSPPVYVDNNVPGLVELGRDPPTTVCDAPP